MQRFAVIGLVLTVAGVVLAVGFWPLVSLSGARLLAARSGNQYPAYAPDTRILIRERVIGIAFAGFFGNQLTRLDLDDGNPDVHTYVYVQGDARPVVANDSVIYASAVLRASLGVEYWEIATPADIRPSWPVDAAFYGITGLGVAMLIWIALRAPRAGPPKG